MELRTGKYAYDVHVDPMAPMPSGDRWAAKVVGVTEHTTGKAVKVDSTEKWGKTPGEAMDKAFNAAMASLKDTNEE